MRLFRGVLPFFFVENLVESKATAIPLALDGGFRTNSIKKYRAGTARINTCGDSRLRGR